MPRQKKESGYLTVRKDKLSKQNVILYLFGMIPVVWLGLLIAPCMENGLMSLIQEFGTVMENPFQIKLCEDSVKTVLVLLLIYGIAIGVYLSTEHNYRRREEHGSAKWGSSSSVNKKYADKRKTENKLLTQNVAIGLDGRKHRRNLNVLVCGGSGAGKTRFFAKPNIMNANSFLEEGRDEEWCRNFRDEIVKRGIKLKLRGSVVAENVTKEKVLLLKESGFYSFACGIENFSQSVLNRYGKRATVIDNIRALRAFKECGIIIQCGIILFDPYTTLSELKDNYRYLTFFPEVVMKGIFSELYAAEGSNFTNKILLDPNTGEHVLHNENYTYDIIDEKVRTVYTLLKEWQQSHSTMYDMLVDPLNAPKNISLQNLERLMLIYQQVHKYDLDVLGLILEQIEYADSSNIKKQLAKKAINLQNTFVVIEKTIKKIYEEEDLVFDGHKNKYLC